MQQYWGWKPFRVFVPKALVLADLRMVIVLLSVVFFLRRTRNFEHPLFLLYFFEQERAGQAVSFDKSM